MDFLRRWFSTESFQKENTKKLKNWDLTLPPPTKNVTTPHQTTETNQQKLMERDLLLMSEILYDERRRVDIVPTGMHELESFPDKATNYDWLMSETPSLMKFHQSKFYPPPVEQLRLNKIGVLPTIYRMWASSNTTADTAPPTNMNMNMNTNTNNIIYMWNFLNGDDIIQLKHPLSKCVNHMEVVAIDNHNNILATHLLFLFSDNEICAIAVDFSQSREYTSFDYRFSLNHYSRMKVLDTFICSTISNPIASPIKCIKTTSTDGYIFIADNAGVLYELCYKMKDGKFLHRDFRVENKFSDKIIRKNMFNTWFRNEKLNNEDFQPIQMEIDEERAYLYLLCSNNVVKVYTINLEHSKITEHVIFNASNIKLPYNKNIKDTHIFSRVVSIGVCSKKYSKVAKFILQYETGARGFFSIFEHYTENQKQYCAEMVHFIYPRALVNSLETSNIEDDDDVNNNNNNNNCGGDGSNNIKMSSIADAAVNLCLHTTNSRDSIQSVFLAQQIQSQIGEVYPVTNYEICECDLNVASIVPFKLENSRQTKRKRPYYFAENTTVQCESECNLYLIHGVESYCILRVTEISDVVEKALLYNEPTQFRRLIDDFIKRYGLMTVFFALLSLHTKVCNSNDTLQRDILHLIMEAFYVRHHFKMEKSFDKGYEIVLVPCSSSGNATTSTSSSVTNNHQQHKNYSMIDANEDHNFDYSFNNESRYNNFAYQRKPVNPIRRSNTIYRPSEKSSTTRNGCSSGKTSSSQTTTKFPPKSREMALELNSLCEKYNHTTQDDSRKRKFKHLTSVEKSANGVQLSPAVPTTNPVVPDTVGPQYLNQLSVYSLGFNQFFAINVEALFNSLIVDQTCCGSGSGSSSNSNSTSNNEAHYYFSRLKLSDIEYWQNHLARIKASFNECRFVFHSKFENIPLIDSIDILNAKTIQTLEYLSEKADRSIQLLNFFAIIFEYDLDKFIKYVLSKNKTNETLKTTKFGTFVTNISLTRNLISEFINYIDYTNGGAAMNLRSILKQISSLCASYFDSSDMQFIMTTKHLIDIYNMSDEHEKTISLQNTLTVLKVLNRSISTIACFELLFELGCLNEVLVLASSRYTTTVMSSCTLIESTYLLYFVLRVLDLLYVKHLSDNNNLIDSDLFIALRTLLTEVVHKHFHFIIYYWITVHNLIDIILLHMDVTITPFITEFISIDIKQMTAFLNDVCGVNPSIQFLPKSLLLQWKFQEKNHKTRDSAKTLIQLSQIIIDTQTSTKLNDDIYTKLSDKEFNNTLKTLISDIDHWSVDSVSLYTHDKIRTKCDMSIINHHVIEQNFNIHDRLDYLGRAMIYLKNHVTDHSLFISSSNEKLVERSSDLLVECETFLKAAKMQLFVYNEVERINMFVPTPASNILSKTLFYSVFNYLELVNKIIEPYGLHCSKLMSLIQLGVSTQNDYLVQLWKSIIEREFYLVLRSDDNNNNNSVVVSTKSKSTSSIDHITVKNSLKDIFKCFRVENAIYFPLYDIFRIVHVYSCQYTLHYNWCYELMLDIQLDVFKLFELYIRLLNDPINNISYDKQNNISYPILCALNFMEFVFNCEEFLRSLTQNNKNIKNRINNCCDLGVIIQKQLPRRIRDQRKLEDYLRRLRVLITKLSTFVNLTE